VLNPSTYEIEFDSSMRDPMHEQEVQEFNKILDQFTFKLNKTKIDQSKRSFKVKDCTR